MGVTSTTATSVARKAAIGVAGTTATTVDGKVWRIHILVGDGIATNELAARGLLAALQASPLPCSIVYFVVCLRCAAHQANLATGSAVRGHSAACSDHGGAGKKIGNSFCGVAVRLYKYLLAENYEESVQAARAWSDRVLEVLPWSECSAENSDDGETFKTRSNQARAACTKSS